MCNTPALRAVLAVAFAALIGSGCAADVAERTSIVMQAYCTYTDATGVPMPPAESNRLSLNVWSRWPWITQWLVNGPHYPGNGLPSVWWDPFQGETFLFPYEGMISRSRVWQSASTDCNGMLNLLQYFPSSKYTVAYAHAYIHSPVEQQALLLLGSDDGLRVFVNGRSEVCKKDSRSFQPDVDRVLVKLKAGTNRLLLKTTHLTKEWRLSARIDADHAITVIPPPLHVSDDTVFYVLPGSLESGDGLSWDSALPDIQRAIDIASEVGGGQVWVAAGEYTGSIRLKPSVHVYGGFGGYESSLEQRDISANPTVVRAYGARYGVLGATGATLDSVKVTGGSFGILCENTSPLISACDIYENETGIYTTGSSAPGLLGCRIYANDWYGIQCHNGSSAWIRQCVISENLRVGAYCYSQSNAEFSDCIIDRNGTHGVLVEYSSPRLSNCTLAFNGGFGVHSYSSNVSVVNSILCGNGWAGGGAVAVTLGSTPKISYSCFWENGPAEFVGLTSPVGSNGNIRSDPLFYDSAGAAYCPHISSMCVDAGDNYQAGGDTDIWGRRRIVRRTVDMGAVEAQ